MNIGWDLELCDLNLTWLSGRWKHTICVDWWGNIWHWFFWSIFHVHCALCRLFVVAFTFPFVFVYLHLYLHHHVVLSSSAVVNDTWLENVAPPTAYLAELTPNICMTIVDGNTHTCAFSFTKFFEIQWKFAIYVNGNPASVILLSNLLVL